LKYEKQQTHKVTKSQFYKYRDAFSLSPIGLKGNIFVYFSLACTLMGMELYGIERVDRFR